jgi:hypothetical protein
MRSLSFAVLSLLSLPLAPSAQERIDQDAVTRIRAEGMDRSQVMDTLWWLTDRYGPRLTNSPQERRALQWAKERLESYGLEKAALEPWGEFGVGWSFERCVVEMTTPIYMPIIAIPRAWTLGLDKPVHGEPLLVEAESVADLDKYKGKLAGRIVMRGTVRDTETPFDAWAKRTTRGPRRHLRVREPPRRTGPSATARTIARGASWRRSCAP